MLQLAVDQGVRLRYAGDMDDRGLQIAEDVARTYGAQLVAMDTATVVEAGPEPSAVTIGSLPQTCNKELIEALRACGRVVFQEHDVVLRRLFDVPTPPAGL